MQSTGREKSKLRVVVNAYILILQTPLIKLVGIAEQDDNVASWSDQTIEKLKAVIRSCLRETEYDSQSPPQIGIFIAFTNYL